MGKGYHHDIKDWQIPQMLGYFGMFLALVGIPSAVLFLLKGDTSSH